MLTSNTLMLDVEQLIRELIIKEPMQHFGVNKALNSFIGHMRINLFLPMEDRYLIVPSQSNGINTCI